MSIWSIFALVCAFILSFTVLSAGQAKLTDRITEEIHAKYLAKEKETAFRFVPLSPADQREVVGVLDLICGISLLVPSWKRFGAVLAFLLLATGIVPRYRRGESVKPTMLMMGLSVVVWAF